MKRISRARALFAGAALAAFSGAALATQASLTLTMDDSVVSSNVQFIKGRPYVPLSDVASMLNLTVVRKGNTYSLALNGPGDKSRGVTGKITANLISNAWQFRVISAERASGYSPLYGDHKEQVTPKEIGDTLVVVKCRLRNSTKVVQDVCFDKGSAGNTALTDSQGNGYVPLSYDSRNSDYSSDKIPAGTVHDFVVIFSVPTGAGLKDLIYTAGSTGMDKSTDFRVSLTP